MLYFLNLLSMADSLILFDILTFQMFFLCLLIIHWIILVQLAIVNHIVLALLFTFSMPIMNSGSALHILYFPTMFSGTVFST